MPEPEHATPVRAAAAGAVTALGPLLHDVVVRALHLWPEPSDIPLRVAVADWCGSGHDAGGGDGVDDAPVRAALRAACAIARAGGLRVEHLLVRLKAAWVAVPEAHRTLRADGADVLARVVTRCIEADYAPGDDPDVSSAEPATPTGAPAERSPDRMPERPARRPRRPSASRRRTPEPALRVVVVDDTPSLRRMLIRLLTCAGHTVVGEAGTAADAVACAAALAPDVVLLDLHLPDGLGTEVAGRLTARAGTATRPPAVVLCTGDADAVTGADLAHAGVFAVLPKPVSLAHLDHAVRAAARARAATLAEGAAHAHDTRPRATRSRHAHTDPTRSHA